MAARRGETAAPAATSTGVVVLGMHRSGTSALSRLLQELGCGLGGEGIAAAPDNPHGFHEHAGIVAIHDDFLHLAGRAWSDAGPLSPREFEGPAAAGARERLARLFDEELRPLSRWVMKDPRMCRLLPLWSGILRGREGLDVRFLHLARSPLAVARSLELRDGIGRARSLLLWVRHNLEAEAGSRGGARSWLDWDEFQRRPRAALEEACRSAGLAGLFDAGELAGAIERAYVPASVHHRADPEAERALLAEFPWARQVREALGRFGRGEEREARALMDRTREELARADAFALDEADPAGGGLGGGGAGRMAREIEALRVEVHALRQETRSPYLSALLAKSLDTAGRIEASWRAAREERDHLAEERDRLREAGRDLAAERDARAGERDRYAAECDRLNGEHVRLAREREHLAVRLGEILADGDAARAELARTREELAEARSELSRTRERLTAERDALRAYFLNSRSWRLTGPLRRLMNALRGTAPPAP